MNAPDEASLSDPEEVPIAVDDAPSPEEMAAYVGEDSETGDTSEASSKDERPLPSLEDVEKTIPDRTKALMDELFRAKLEKVKRIDPKEIR